LTESRRSAIKRNVGFRHVIDARRLVIRTGWRLALSLSALAVVAVAVSLMLLTLVSGPDERPLIAAADGSIARPWAACARAVRQELPHTQGLELAGPTLVRWESSGVGVDLAGRAIGGGLRATAFGCHAIRLGSEWQVERLILAEP
jgi:hypothetical protein